MKAYQHFKTITYHKWLVMKGCFSIGLYRQGICHDLSKYSLVEFLVGARFYQGTRSPNNAEREWRGYSEAWLHHKGRNKHHYEYWIDYSTENIKGGMAPAPMPIRYILEMIMDRIAASRVYAKEEYTQANPLAYYLWGRQDAPLHPKTRAALDLLLQLLAEYGEKEMVRFIRKEIIPVQKKWDDPREWPLMVEAFRKEYGLKQLG
ncbi:MAG: DUF5662 family protein [Lachnospiraceae bacterium]